MEERAGCVYFGKAIWIGDTGASKNHQFDSVIERIPSSAAFSSFVGSISPHSLCNVGWRHWVWVCSSTPSAPGVGADTNKRGTVYFRHPTSLEVLHFTYPDPIATDLEDVGYGKRIKNPVVVAIVGYLSTLAGISYVPLYGVFTVLS